MADVLTGPDGCLSERWVALDISQSWNGLYDLTPFLMWPTPRLRSLKLGEVSITTGGWPEGTFLHFTPSLETILLDSCFLPYIPNISKAKYVGLHYPRNQKGYHYPNMTDLRNATQVQRLELNVSGQAKGV
jgi:hypothetical protein